MIIRGLANILRRASGPTNAGLSRWYPLTSLGFGGADPLTIPSFRSGVDRKASMVGSMPVYTEVNGRRRDFVPPLLWQPDPSEERFATLHKMVASFVYHGEVVAPITQWSPEGFAQSLVVVDPAQCTLSGDGLTWRIGDLTLPRFEVMHLVRFPVPGSMRGAGAVRLYREFFDGVDAMERFQRTYYTEGGTPSVVVTLNDDAGEDELQEARAAWKQRLSKREPVVIPHTVKAESFQLSNVDQQYLQSKEFTLTEIANIVGIPGAYVGAPNGTGTYQNIQDTRRELVDVYLRPDIVLLEAGFSSFLTDGMKAKLDTNALLRTDPQATAELLTAELAYKTMNEVRAELGLPPVDGGDVIGAHYTPPSSTPVDGPALPAAPPRLEVAS